MRIFSQWNITVVFRLEMEVGQLVHLCEDPLRCNASEKVCRLQIYTRVDCGACSVHVLVLFTHFIQYDQFVCLLYNKKVWHSILLFRWRYPIGPLPCEKKVLEKKVALVVDCAFIFTHFYSGRPLPVSGNSRGMTLRTTLPSTSLSHSYENDGGIRRHWNWTRWFSVVRDVVITILWQFPNEKSAMLSADWEQYEVCILWWTWVGCGVCDLLWFSLFVYVLK